MRGQPTPAFFDRKMSSDPYRSQRLPDRRLSGGGGCSEPFASPWPRPRMATPMWNAAAASSQKFERGGQRRELRRMKKAVRSLGGPVPWG